MITIPDNSVTQAFGTNEYTEISLLRPFNTGINLGAFPAGKTVTADIQTIEWNYSEESGIQSSLGSDTQSLPVTQNGEGLYSLTLPAQFSPLGLILTWYVADQPVWKQYFMARYFMPLWSSLNTGVQTTLTGILHALELLHDNSYGNSKPNLAENIQVHYSMETIAQAAQTALQVFQSQIIQPTNYSLNTFPPLYYGLLYTAALRELVHRFYIGYLETPDIHGDVGVAYADRHGYFDKWKTEYDKLTETFQQQLSIYERQQLDLTGAVDMVAGGFYGRGGAFMQNQRMQAIQNGIIQNQFYMCIMNYNPGPLAGGE